MRDVRCWCVCVSVTWAVVTGLSKEEKSPRPQPAQHLLHCGLELLVTQVHQQPVGEDDVKTAEDSGWTCQRTSISFRLYIPAFRVRQLIDIRRDWSTIMVFAWVIWSTGNVAVHPTIGAPIQTLFTRKKDFVWLIKYTIKTLYFASKCSITQNASWILSICVWLMRSFC